MSNNITVQIAKLSRELEAARQMDNRDYDHEDDIESQIMDLQDELEFTDKENYNVRHNSRFQ